MRNCIQLTILLLAVGAQAQTTTNEWIDYLEQKMIDRHVGGGAYAIAPGETGYDLYADAVTGAEGRASDSLANYANYNIQTNASGDVTGGVALGTIDQIMMLDFYGLGLAVHIYPGQESEAKARAFVKWLEWAGLTESNMSATYLGAFGRAAFLVHSALDTADQIYLRGIFFGTVGSGKIEHNLHIAENGTIDDGIGMRSADVLRQHSGSLLPAILMLPDSTPAEQQTRQEYLSRAKNAIVFGATPISGVRGLLKPDYTGSHHYYHYTSAYVPQAAAALASMVEFMQGSPWQLSETDLDGIKGYARELYFYTQFDHAPNALSGRGFADKAMPSQSYHLLPLAAMAGAAPDAELLQVLINTYRSDMSGLTYNPCYRLNQRGYPGYLATLARARQAAEQQSISPQFIDGVRSYPYSPALAKRKNNWMAFVRGMNKWWWTYEGGISATNPQAYYGIYKSHGSLELRYIDPANPTSGATANPLSRQGMDMSHIPGATTPIRTDEEMINDVIDSRLRINSTSVGGVELGQENGLFMFDLKNCPAGMKDPGFEARKSYFFLGDRIIMLGDNIRSQSPSNYPVHTTLFQNFLDQSDRTQSPIRVNSSTAVTADTYSYDQPNLTNSHVLVDADGTGYYVPPSQHLHVERKNSAWRQTVTLTTAKTDIPGRQAEALALPVDTAYRAFAWLDHGSNPSGVDYEYVVLPNNDYAAVDNFRQQQDLGQIYEVREKSAQAHIVRDLENDLWAYALYADYTASSNGPLRAVNIKTVLPHAHETVAPNPGYAVMMDDSSSNALKLAVSYLDLRMLGDYNPTYSFNDPGTNGERYDYGSAPVELNVAIQGAWRVAGAAPEIFDVQLTNGTTVLTVYCIHGNSVNVELEPEPDTDSDGLADAWETQWFGSITNPVAIPGADPDFDTRDNLLEYALGGNPTNANDAGILPTIGNTDRSVFEYIHRRRTDRVSRGLDYIVERNTNLISGTWTTNGVSISGTAPAETGIETVTNEISTSTEPEQFIRLKIQSM